MLGRRGHATFCSLPAFVVIVVAVTSCSESTAIFLQLLCSCPSDFRLTLSFRVAAIHCRLLVFSEMVCFCAVQSETEGSSVWPQHVIVFQAIKI